MAGAIGNHDREAVRSRQRSLLLPSVVVLLPLLLHILPSQTSAENLTRSAKQSDEAQELKVVIGKSVIIDMPVAIKRASLANPEIADAIVLAWLELFEKMTAEISR